MSLFNEPETGPTAQEIASKLFQKTNLTFQRNYVEHVAEVKKFWANDFLEAPNGPTGIEVLQAMGTSALPFLTVAYARVQMLSSIQAALNRDDLINISLLLPPYTLEFNVDGSLLSWEMIPGSGPDPGDGQGE